MNDAVFSQIDFGPLKEFLEQDKKEYQDLKQTIISSIKDA